MANFAVDPMLMLKRMQAYRTYIKPSFSFGVSNREKPIMKPPNILVYQPKCIQDCPKDDFTNFVEKCLPLNKFAVYRLKYEEAVNAPWMDNCQLLIIPGQNSTDAEMNLDSSEITFFEKYLSLHGMILNFSMSFAKYFNLQTHIIRPADTCSFIDKHSNTLTEISTLGSNSLVFQFQDIDASNVILSAKYSDSQMCPVAIRCAQNGGEIIHCSVPLLDAAESTASDKDSAIDETRTVLFKHLFKELGIANDMPTSTTVIPKETPCVILSEKSDELIIFLRNFNISFPESCMMKGMTTTLKFKEVESYTSEIMQPMNNSTNDSVSVLYCLNPSSTLEFINFDWAKFESNLNTKLFAKTVIYSDVVTSTMDIIEPFVGKLLHRSDVTLTCICRQQTQGKGRGGNKWLSPIGTAMFSHVFSIPRQSNLGQHLSVLQHLTTVSVVHAIRSIHGLENLDIRVKWPNDIYIGKDVKIGGVLVKSTIFNNALIATVGCGVNVSNDSPTKCVNDAIREANISHSLLNCEEVLARTLTCLEEMINSYQLNGPDEFLTLYYKYWIHSNQEVQISLPDTKDLLTKAIVVGIDNSGFLCAKLPDGNQISLQPDSNSFDMTKNLIAMKSYH